MAHTSAAHVPNLACGVFFPSFTEQRGAGGIEGRWGGVAIGGKESYTSIYYSMAAETT